VLEVLLHMIKWGCLYREEQLFKQFNQCFTTDNFFWFVYRFCRFWSNLRQSETIILPIKTKTSADLIESCEPKLMSKNVCVFGQFSCWNHCSGFNKFTFFQWGKSRIPRFPVHMQVMIMS